MDKTAFISEITPVLRGMNYRKNRNYWYRFRDGYTECINVEGSQWDKNNYFIEIGFALPDPQKKFPTLLEWYARHMVIGKGGQYNILPEELYREMEEIFGAATSVGDFPEIFAKYHGKRVGLLYPQYRF